MSSRSTALQDVKTLSPAQRTALKKSNLKDFSDVVLTPPSELAKRLKISLSEAQLILETVYREIARSSIRVDNIEQYTDDKFTTGDAVLDRIIGGGIKTGMIWELAGESASGKTQLALQLCLLVQLRPMLGGLSGSACYLSTHAQLSTKRLSQLISDHPLLSPSVCNLSDIHTVSVPTSELLIRTLTVTFPALQDDLRKDPTRKPVRLVVIDSVSALFHSSGKASSSTLFERSRALSELSRAMHTIAARDNIAFVVINEVTDVFGDYYTDIQEGVSKSDILYRDQAKWFNSAHSIPAESAKEACLGLVWANQLNARIMLTRTNRRRHLDDPRPRAKRIKVDGGLAAAGSSQTENDDDFGQAMVLRRFSVVFSSVAAPGSVDFVVTNAGVSAIQDEAANTTTNSKVIDNVRERHVNIENGPTSTHQVPETVDPSDDMRGVISQQFVKARLVAAPDEGQSSEISTGGDLEVIPSTYPEVDEFDDEGHYWEEFDEIPYDALPDVDFDGLERSQIEEDLQPSQSAIAAVGNG